MLLHVVPFMLCLIGTSHSTPIYTTPYHLDWASHTFPIRRSPSFPNPDRHAVLVARTAVLRKFHNAPALLAGQGISPGYVVPISLQETYDHASDLATNIALLNSQLNSFANPLTHSPFAVGLAGPTLLGNQDSDVIDTLTDETDGINDFEYYGQLNFGSQRQSLQLDFDTGSADLWVPVGCQNCGQLKQFQANASTTFRNTSEPFAIEYGQGSVMGTLASDTVRVASLEVANQYFGGVRLVSEDFANSPNDGIVGLAFSTIAVSGRPTFFENLIPQLPAPLFSVYMTRTQTRGSEIRLGGIDVQKTRENAVSWMPVTSKTYWTVNISSVLINDTPVHVSQTQAIIDTGTSFIYGPSRFVTAIYALIPGSALASDYGAGFHTYPCNASLALSFVFGPHTLPMDPRDVNLGKYTYDPTGSTCIGAIAGLESSDFDFFIIGDSFLKSYLSIYDYSHGGRVGFAKSVNE